jgi:hypothetical protein
LNNLLLEDAWKTNKHGLLPSLFTHCLKIVGAGSTASCGGEEVRATCDYSQRIIVQGLPAPARRRAAWRIPGSNDELAWSLREGNWRGGDKTKSVTAGSRPFVKEVMRAHISVSGRAMIVHSFFSKSFVYQCINYNACMHEVHALVKFLIILACNELMHLEI